MSASPTNTYGWYVTEWEYRHYGFLTTLSLSNPTWSTTLALSMRPFRSGILFPPDDHTVTFSETYAVSGIEVTLMEKPDQILFRRSPSTRFESSRVETKTLIPPVEILRPSSTTEGGEQTASAADATTSEDASSGESSASAVQSGGSSQATGVAAASDSDNPGLGGGAIAGIAMGGILVLALIIGGWFFWRRRKRARARTSVAGDDEQARGGRDTVVPVAQYSPWEKQPYHPHHHHHHHHHHQEMPGDVPTPARELDGPTPSPQYAMNGARHSTSKTAYQYEPAFELNPDSRPAEFPGGREEYFAPVHHHQRPEPAVHGDNAVEGAETAGNTASPNVEAQRRREMEWLEMEEERIRKRRETLSLQGSGKSV